jgi:quercetin dioxygenase-like cupin family protein
VIRLGCFEQIPPESPHDGVERRVLSTSQATVQEYRFDPGATFPLHRHPQEQITLVLEGEVSFTADGQPHELRTGAWSVVPGDVDHGITAGVSGARFLAILVPARTESLP